MDVLPGMELMSCPNLAVPRDVMHHVVRVESSYNPYAIGVVGGRLVRQPQSLAEAVSTARMLEERGYNFSLGLAQVNRYNLSKYGLTSYEHAFQPCANLVAGSRILRECYGRSGGDWGKSFSCYYSGDFRTGFRHGYVQKVYASMRRGISDTFQATGAAPIAVVDRTTKRSAGASKQPGSLMQRRAVKPFNTPPGATDIQQASAGVHVQALAVPSQNGIPPSEDLPSRSASMRPAPAIATATASASTPASAVPGAEQGDGAFVF